MSEANKGRIFTKEHLENMSKSRHDWVPWNVGIAPSNETRQKISNSLKKYNASKKYEVLQ